MTKQKIIGYYPIDFEYQQSMREKTIAFLGNKCNNQKCLVPGGCTDKRCLQIDHINGISEEEPRLVGAMLYEDILFNPNSKEKYQLLCANCNWIKRYEKNEKRGYIQYSGQLKPKFPKSYIKGCTNPNASCKTCDVKDCYDRVKSK
jgi:hypothetical protein